MVKGLPGILSRLYGFVDIILIIFLIFDFGFKENLFGLSGHKTLSLVLLTVTLILINVLRIIFTVKLHLIKWFKVNIIILVATLLAAGLAYLFGSGYTWIEKVNNVIDTGLIIYLFVRLTSLLRKLYNIYYNPTVLFVGSFFAAGFIGAAMLMLPNATSNGITFTDALFTSVSAVCVTGLAVLDTATDFTFMGKTIILVLIQLGGIGMLTFTSFFSYFFKGSSFREGLNVSSFVDSDQLQDVMRLAMRVVVFTLGIELVGAVLVYSFIADIPAIENKVFFSIFHAVSAFCNAGFSTLSLGLNDPALDTAYAFQWIIMHLIILGGLGYGIVFNFLRYLKEYFLNYALRGRMYAPVRVLTLNTKIVLVTTALLLTLGTIFFFLTENNKMYAGKSVFSKLTDAAFTSVTTRTAGFNTFDFADLTMPSILFVMLLMWIGASPGSTGGGIKTSTFALATINIISIAKGKEQIELGGRKINNQSVKRAFAIICISLMVIGFAILLMLFFEEDFTLIQLAFEAFSAFSTVGLSLGITSDLSTESKYVLICVMFFGRIGLLNLLMGMLKRLHSHSYEYPEENIFIN